MVVMSLRHAPVVVLLLLPLAATPPAATATPPPTCDGRPATITGPGVPRPDSGLLWIVGTPGADVIVGTETGEGIEGLAGNDVVCALGGADHVFGGTGDDRLFGGLDQPYVPGRQYEGDTIAPGPGDDHVDLGADPQAVTLEAQTIWPAFDSVSYDNATGPVVVDLAGGTATGEGTDTLVVAAAAGVRGSAFDDRLLGSDFPDVVQGGGGDDLVRGGSGDDHLTDDWEPGPGNDTVLGGAGDDWLQWVGGRNTFLGGRGADRLEQVSLSGRGWMRGGRGRDDLSLVVRRLAGVAAIGGPGRDSAVVTLVGLPKRTLVVVDHEHGWLATEYLRLRYADVEASVVRQDGALRLHHTFLGGAARDSIRVPGSAALRAWGRRGDDVLVGTRGDDLLVGGPGVDVLRADGGLDRCLGGETVVGCELP